jgi:hypothetical protein
MTSRKVTNDVLTKELFNEGPKDPKGPGLGDYEDV